MLIVYTVRHYETEILWNVSYHLDLDSAHSTLCLPEKFNQINILLWVKIFFLLQPTEVVSGHYKKGRNWSVSHDLEDITLISLFNCHSDADE